MKKNILPILLLIISPVICLSEKFSAQDWPSWRGADDTGSVATGDYPVEFNDTENVVWRFKMPGIGCSTPIVIGKEIFVTSPIDSEDGLLCLSWEGKLLWQATVGDARKGKHRNGSGSNPSPVTDGESIFVYYKSGNLAGFDLTGKELWSTNLQDRFGKDSLYWDLGTSPVLTEKNVIVAVMHHGKSFVAAFDKSTGKINWKVDRNYQTPVEGDHSYATPHVINHQGKETIVIWGAEHLTAHDAVNGELIWSCGGFNPDKNNNWVQVASSILSGDIAVVPYGRGSHIAGIKMSGTGDITSTNRLWTRDDVGSFVPTPAVSGNKVYILSDKGEITCLNSKTGETIVQASLPKNRNKYYASPTIAGNHLYAAREDGTIFVADMTQDFQVLSENNMKQRLIASVVPIDGQLLVRGEEDLFLIGNQ